jgi:hypothetical protein
LTNVEAGVLLSVEAIKQLLLDLGWTHVGPLAGHEQFRRGNRRCFIGANLTNFYTVEGGEIKDSTYHANTDLAAIRKAAQ